MSSSCVTDALCGNGTAAADGVTVQGGGFAADVR
jgi:hypothetical protein